MNEVLTEKCGLFQQVNEQKSKESTCHTFKHPDDQMNQENDVKQLQNGNASHCEVTEREVIQVHCLQQTSTTER